MTEEITESTPMNGKSFLGYDYKALLLIGGCAGAWFVGYLVNGIAPIFMQTLGSTLAISESAAGYLISIEFAGAGLATLFVGAQVDRLSKRSVALAGCLLAVAANVGSMFIDHYGSLLAIRLLAGIGTGSAVVGGAAAVARYREPERMYGVVNVLLAISFSASVVIVSNVLGVFGKPGVFGFVAVAYAAMIPLIFLLPTDINLSGEKQERHKLPVVGLGVTFVAGYVIAMIGQNAGWVFAVAIGESSGFNLEQIGKIIGISAISGVAGAMLSASIGTRFGRAIPAAAGVSALGLTWGTMCLVPSSTMFPVLIIVNSISFYFCVSFLVGVAAKLDEWGRWASVTAGSTLFGSIIGPAVGGILVQYGGINVLGWSILCSTGISLTLILFVVILLAGKEARQANTATTPDPR
ncbi:MAG: MFS transporter [Gammaproteobacteria bacterium]|nr:MFS transporter [Gammaproteobacteria bacterium]